ncbi:hypothetical protein [Microbacterium sp. K24]|uniref:hypothetical protein n=1 Tax=Microbacterium sp. K24 TaxID=2305446 RepID=UPI00109C05D7|nr:hypothetical protein [Microbacterium sp. K24]
MNSRSGDRVPAGVSGQAGRGTVGTDAPTARSGVALFSPVLRAVAAGYAVLRIALIWVSLLLAPWGLLILLLAFGALLAAAMCAFMAAGISELEAAES